MQYDDLYKSSPRLVLLWRLRNRIEGEVRIGAFGFHDEKHI